MHEASTKTARPQMLDGPGIGRPISDLVLDRRTRVFKRKGEIAAMFRIALGAAIESNPVLAVKVDTAAELAVVAEQTRASFMAGAGATADDVVRTSRAAALAEQRLGIDVRRNSPKPDLSSYLAGRRQAA